MDSVIITISHFLHFPLSFSDEFSSSHPPRACTSLTLFFQTGVLFSTALFFYSANPPEELLILSSHDVSSHRMLDSSPYPGPASHRALKMHFWFFPYSACSCLKCNMSVQNLFATIFLLLYSVFKLMVFLPQGIQMSLSLGLRGFPGHKTFTAPTAKC